MSGSVFGDRRFLYASLGNISETPGSTNNAFFGGSVYESTRGPSGWTSAGLMPPQGEFEIKGSQLVPSSDDGAVVWSLYPLNEAGARIGVYRNEGGVFSVIGPTTPVAGGGSPAPRPVAGDSDLSRIALSSFLSVESAPYVWPGDTTLTGSSTLYEYDLSEPAIGTSAAEPKLVGVTNSGRLRNNTEAQLVSQCGIVLGGGTVESQSRAISSDGKYLFFTAEHEATPACEAAVQPRVNEIYARVDGTHTVAISEPSAQDCATCLQGAAREAAEGALTASQRATYLGASADGTKVFFSSWQELLPGIKGTSGGPNLYRFDFDAPEGRRLEVISPALGGAAEVLLRFETGEATNSIATDGERAYYLATGPVQTSPGARNEANALGQKPQPGQPNLYMWEAASAGRPARVAFVATLLSGLDSIISNPIATPDGRFVVFDTAAQLTPGDAGTATQLFEYDAGTGGLVRVSVGDRGFNADGNSDTEPASGQRVSADGRRVFFMSSAALTPGALNDPTDTAHNVYEWTWAGAEPTEAAARVALISDGRQEGPLTGAGASGTGAFLLGIDPEGETVYFLTNSRLVPQDTDTQTSVYAARAGGGFPGLAAEPACEGEACQGMPSVPATPGIAGTAGFHGVGNAKAHAVNRKCSRAASQAARLRRRVKALRLRASHVRDAGRAQQMRRKAQRLAHRAHKRSRAADRCGRSDHRNDPAAGRPRAASSIYVHRARRHGK
jgi:hypothetical protein